MFAGLARLRCLDDVLLDRVGMHSRVEESMAALFCGAQGLFELRERVGAKQTSVRHHQGTLDPEARETRWKFHQRARAKEN
jgi:hypothetical protein